jgi:hypothetical protein
MPFKSEVLETITKPTYSQKEVRILVNSVTSSIKSAPEYFKKGDVFYTGVGTKRRPAIVVKVLKDRVFAIPVTHEDGIFSLLTFHSRFLGDGYLTNNIVSANILYVRENFLGVFDNNKALNQGIKLLKEIINSI